MANPNLQLPKPSFARVDFRPDLIDQQIVQHGLKVIWEKSMFCSCYDLNSGQPAYLCPACKGRGYIYFDPKPTIVLATSISGHKDQDKIGLYDRGTAYITTLSTDEIGFRDRITFVDATIRFSEILTRGPLNSHDNLKYPAKSIISVRQKITVYNGTQYMLTEDGAGITWNTEPPTFDSQYSILYTTSPVYICINPIHELRGTYSMYKSPDSYYVNLPKQFQIKREDFLDIKEV